MPNRQGNGASGEFLTFVGAGFGTAQMAQAVGDQPTPESAAARQYLRGGLPGIYRDGDFGMRFIGELEHVVDPVVALLDNVAAHFTPAYAPRDVLELLMAWFGLEHDETYGVEDRRALVAHAPELIRLRGTRAGLELALSLAFPGAPLRVEDGGGVTYSVELTEPDKGYDPAFVVYCDKPVPQSTQAAIARLIARMKPVNTAFRLRVKAPRARAGEAASAQVDEGTSAPADEEASE